MSERGRDVFRKVKASRDVNLAVGGPLVWQTPIWKVNVGYVKESACGGLGFLSLFWESRFVHPAAKHVTRQAVLTPQPFCDHRSPRSSCEASLGYLQS